ncbi:HTH-type transcriptional regulator Hpr, partial [Bacillaceae bacterium Marseille-Q3522]|nr:HTH-type transcriptional regulator Hpr [Bacillaceae bacterium Marseille-Q3522]
HHILWIAYHLNGASISDVAKFGVMHVSTAFNFSKKLEERGFLTFSKKEDDKRNTYIKLTNKGKDLLIELIEKFEPEKSFSISGAKSLRDLYGKFPEIIEMMTIVRNIYGADFMKIFENSFHNIEEDFDEVDGTLRKKAKISEKL